MCTFKMILYPFGLAITAMFIVTLFGMAIFGWHSTDWAVGKMTLSAPLEPLPASPVP